MDAQSIYITLYLFFISFGFCFTMLIKFCFILIMV